jgi:hypothetical protein
VDSGMQRVPPRLSPVSRSYNLTTTSGSTPHRGGLNFPQKLGGRP